MRSALLLPVALSLGCAAAPPRFVALDVSPTHACAVDRDGDIWCWGEGPAWETKRRPGEDAQVATRVDVDKIGLEGGRGLGIATGIERTCALATDGRASCWLSPYEDDPAEALFEVYSADSRVFAELRIDDIMLTARNALGGLDQRDMLDVRDRGRLDPLLGAPRLDPIVAFDSNCAADASGSVVCWRWQRDLDSGTAEFVMATVGEQLGEIVDLAGPCVVGADGLVRCPDGDFARDWSVAGTRLEVVAGLEDVVEIERDHETVCVRLRDGTVHCRGENRDGDLGDGSTLPRADFHELAGVRGAALLRVKGWGCAAGQTQVWCWGTPGLAFSSSAELSPIESQRLALDASRVFVERDVTCVEQRRGSVSCFGLRTTAGMQGSAQVRTVHSIRGLARPIEAMASDGRDLCLIAGGRMLCTQVPIDDDDLLHFGRSVELPVERSSEDAGAAAGEPVEVESQQGRCSIDEGEQVRCHYASRTYEPPARDVVELVAGRDHHCARERGGDVVCWGPNYRGEIGKLPGRVRWEPTLVTFADGSPVGRRG